MEIKTATLPKSGTLAKLIFTLLLLNSLLMTSCAQQEDVKAPGETTAQVTQPNKQAAVDAPQPPKHKDPHPFGGWYCPDNLNGLPAVDIADWEKVPVVNGRLPTREETRNGTSLMYFDPAEHPDAKALEMTMPRLARFQSEVTGKNELVIIIQAIEENGDSVVGFRYLNGGNGTSWFDEVTFLSDTEIDELGSLDFVTIETDIKATKDEIWEVITDPQAGENLGKKHDEPALTTRNWTPSPLVTGTSQPDHLTARGELPDFWGNKYIQMDYNIDGHHYVEKILIMRNANEDHSHILVVVGPYRTKVDAQQLAWQQWLQKVKILSEAK